MTFKDKFGKTKNVLKNAKERVVDQFDKVKRQKFFHEFNATKGEVVVTQECRKVLAKFLYFLVTILWFLGIGEIIWAIIMYFIMNDFSDFMSNTTVSSVITYMIITCVVIIIYNTIFIYIIECYQSAQEEDNIATLKISHVWLKVIYYASYSLVVILITLMIWLSHYFHHFSNDLKISFESHSNQYLKNEKFKVAIDTIQWTYMCCGYNSYEDWHKKSTFHLNSPNKEWLKKQFNSIDNKLLNKTVPFSCCQRQYSSLCRFYATEDTVSINTVGCVDQVNKSLKPYMQYIQRYRLLELVMLFVNMILIDLIIQSLHSQYDAHVLPPTARFPTLHVIAMFLILLLLYLTTFTTL
ncbi:CD151 antigen-like [Oppia nitens]|uniref:CD151 antigen-like n=1 Tax=Oppia nitens TaxID=1686743 RepID=UPI0023DB8F6D|nr:CD151 antigen-like [Oppia nitens]